MQPRGMVLYHLCEGSQSDAKHLGRGQVGKEASWEVVQGGSEGFLCQDGGSEGPGTVAAVAHDPEGQEGHVVISKVPESGGSRLLLAW